MGSRRRFRDTRSWRRPAGSATARTRREPGCAVREGRVERRGGGRALPEYRKLQREARYHAMSRTPSASQGEEPLEAHPCRASRRRTSADLDRGDSITLPGRGTCLCRAIHARARGIRSREGRDVFHAISGLRPATFWMHPGNHAAELLAANAGTNYAGCSRATSASRSRPGCTSRFSVRAIRIRTCGGAGQHGRREPLTRRPPSAREPRREGSRLLRGRLARSREYFREARRSSRTPIWPGDHAETPATDPSAVISFGFVMYFLLQHYAGHAGMFGCSPPYRTKRGVSA